MGDAFGCEALCNVLRNYSLLLSGCDFACEFVWVWVTMEVMPCPPLEPYTMRWTKIKTATSQSINLNKLATDCTPQQNVRSNDVIRKRKGDCVMAFRAWTNPITRSCFSCWMVKKENCIWKKVLCYCFFLLFSNWWWWCQPATWVQGISLHSPEAWTISCNLIELVTSSSTTFFFQCKSTKEKERFLLFFC